MRRFPTRSPGAAGDATKRGETDDFSGAGVLRKPSSAVMALSHNIIGTLNMKSDSIRFGDLKVIGFPLYTNNKNSNPTSAY